jgi:hypothetical protein
MLPKIYPTHKYAEIHPHGKFNSNFYYTMIAYFEKEFDIKPSNCFISYVIVDAFIKNCLEKLIEDHKGYKYPNPDRRNILGIIEFTLISTDKYETKKADIEYLIVMYHRKEKITMSFKVIIDTL